MEPLFLKSECHPEATFYVALVDEDGVQWLSALCAECHNAVFAARVVANAYRVARAGWKSKH